MQLCLFEDGASADLHPLTYFRPVYDLRCGMMTLGERALALLRPRAVVLHARAILRPLLPDLPGIAPGPLVAVNGRALLTPAFAAAVRGAKGEVCFTREGQPVAAVMGPERAARFASGLAADEMTPGVFAGMPCRETDASLMRFPWDLLYANEAALPADFALLRRRRDRGSAPMVHRSAVLVQRRNIVLGPGAEVGPGVVIDARQGPVLLGRGARILPNAVVEGPCFIGEGSVIKVGAQIYGNTSIGPSCKVGGEVEHVIVHSHANKQHDGFLGHSYLCPWVNLGAGTTSSNLKNTYGSVRVELNGVQVDSGRMFVGLLAGDHAKTGINVTLNTGTVIGPGSNIFGTVMPPKAIPSFAWGSGDRLASYDVDKALAVADIVMRRRGLEPTAAYHALFRAIHAMTDHERRHLRP
jgi:UDP-N-acetylglucosamine diphosphorylase/glucosamine-1-phosphate N-acetyltransferase